MSDVLIRDIPESVLTTLDGQAARLGLSRTEYLRRQLTQVAAVGNDSQTWERQKSWTTRGVDHVVGRQICTRADSARPRSDGLVRPNRARSRADICHHSLGDRLLRPLGCRASGWRNLTADRSDADRTFDATYRNPRNRRAAATRR